MFNKQPTGLPFLRLRLLAVTGILLLNLGTTLANDTPTPPPADPAPAPAPATPSGSVYGDTYSQFNVGKWLTVDSSTTDKQGNVGLQGGQDQAYLDKAKSSNPVGAFILQLINLIALTAASLSFLAVVVAGFLMISAAGSENQLNKGKEILSKAIVGLVITLSAYFIVAFVQNLLFETVSK